MNDLSNLGLLNSFQAAAAAGYPYSNILPTIQCPSIFPAGHRPLVSLPTGTSTTQQNNNFTHLVDPRLNFYVLPQSNSNANNARIAAANLQIPVLNVEINRLQTSPSGNNHNQQSHMMKNANININNSMQNPNGPNKNSYDNMAAAILANASGTSNNVQNMITTNLKNNPIFQQKANIISRPVIQAQLMPQPQQQTATAITPQYIRAPVTIISSSNLSSATPTALPSPITHHLKRSIDSFSETEQTKRVKVEVAIANAIKAESSDIEMKTSSSSSSASSTVSTPTIHTSTIRHANKLKTVIDQYSTKPIRIYQVQIPVALRTRHEESVNEDNPQQQSFIPTGTNHPHVNLSLRIMGSTRNLDELYVIASDICRIINVRKSNTAKAVASFNPTEKSSMPILCSTYRMVTSTHILTVLSYKGVEKLLNSSCSPLAKPLWQWIQVEFNNLVKQSNAKSSNMVTSPSLSHRILGYPSDCPQSTIRMCFLSHNDKPTIEIISVPNQQQTSPTNI